MYCVYKHTCPNGKVYIGITCQKPKQRWRHGKGYKNNVLFYHAINKYKWENIKHEILHENLTKEEAEKEETKLIKYFKSNNDNYGYNILDHGNNSIGYHHTKEARRKMSENHGKYYKENNSFYGKHHSEETKQHLRDKWREDEEKYKKRIEHLQSVRYDFPKRKVKCITTNEIFESISEACKKYDLKVTHVCAICRGKRKSTKGLIFEYI